MFTDQKRPLSADDRSFVSKQQALIGRRTERQLRRLYWIVPGLGLVSCVATLFASEVSAEYAVPIWILITILLGIISAVDIRQSGRRQLRMWDEVLAGGHVREIKAEADEVAALPEGNAYQVEPGKLLFVYWEDELPNPQWPTRTIEIIQFATLDGELVWEELRGSGPIAQRVTDLTGSKLGRVRYPEHLSVLDGRVEDLPQVLRR